MTIEYIRIENFGTIDCYEATLAPSLNVLSCSTLPELSAAFDLLLCSKPPPHIPKVWIRADSRICARIRLQDCLYTVEVFPKLTALNPQQDDVTKDYLHALCHCREQDETEHFDANNKKLPLYLFRYLTGQNRAGLQKRTAYSSETEAFRSCLRKFIQRFQPEVINSNKAYQIALTGDGQFYPALPGYDGTVYLSESEQRLFHYLCYLHIARFWTEFETLRNLHHEKKPLIIRNFLEYLDQSIDTKEVIDRTLLLQRQILFLTHS